VVKKSAASATTASAGFCAPDSGKLVADPVLRDLNNTPAIMTERRQYASRVGAACAGLRMGSLTAE
jgi:hypothetical protein